MQQLKRFLRKWLLKETVYYKLNHPDAKMPVLAHGQEDACFDLYSIEAKYIPPYSHLLINCGISFELPSDFELQVRGRSGLAQKGLHVHFGTGDPGYTGDYGPIIFNHTNQSYLVKKGDRVCQVALRPISIIRLKQKIKFLKTKRGEKGFGSSGR